MPRADVVDRDDWERASYAVHLHPSIPTVILSIPSGYPRGRILEPGSCYELLAVEVDQ